MPINCPYDIGDVGPAGGIIVSIPGVGQNTSSYYYEMAPAPIHTASINDTGVDYSCNNPLCGGTIQGGGGIEFACWNQNITSTFSTNTSHEFGEGQNNHNAIIGGSNNSYHFNSGWDDAFNLTSNYALGGYSDWFVPSVEEVREAHDNGYTSLSNPNGGVICTSSGYKNGIYSLAELTDLYPGITFPSFSQDTKCFFSFKAHVGGQNYYRDVRGRDVTVVPMRKFTCPSPPPPYSGNCGGFVTTEITGSDWNFYTNASDYGSNTGVLLITGPQTIVEINNSNQLPAGYIAYTAASEISRFGDKIWATAEVTDWLAGGGGGYTIITEWILDTSTSIPTVTFNRIINWPTAYLSDIDDDTATCSGIDNNTFIARRLGEVYSVDVSGSIAVATLLFNLGGIYPRDIVYIPSTDTYAFGAGASGQNTGVFGDSIYHVDASGNMLGYVQIDSNGNGRAYGICCYNGEIWYSRWTGPSINSIRTVDLTTYTLGSTAPGDGQYYNWTSGLTIADMASDAECCPGAPPPPSSDCHIITKPTENQLLYFPDLSSLSGPGQVIFNLGTIPSVTGITGAQFIGDGVASYGDKIWINITSPPIYTSGSYAVLELILDTSIPSASFNRIIDIQSTLPGHFITHQGIDNTTLIMTYHYYPNWPTQIGDTALYSVDISGTNTIETYLFDTVGGPADVIYLSSSDTYISTEMIGNTGTRHYDSSGTVLGIAANSGVSLFCNNGEVYMGKTSGGNPEIRSLDVASMSFGPSVSIAEHMGDAASNPECCPVVVVPPDTYIDYDYRIVGTSAQYDNYLNAKQAGCIQFITSDISNLSPTNGSPSVLDDIIGGADFGMYMPSKDIRRNNVFSFPHPFVTYPQPDANTYIGLTFNIKLYSQEEVLIGDWDYMMTSTTNLFCGAVQCKAWIYFTLVSTNYGSATNLVSANLQEINYTANNALINTNIVKAPYLSVTHSSVTNNLANGRGNTANLVDYLGSGVSHRQTPANPVPSVGYPWPWHCGRCAHIATPGPNTATSLGRYMAEIPPYLDNFVGIGQLILYPWDDITAPPCSYWYTDPCPQIGDIGPGGGIIFATPSSSFNNTNYYYEMELNDISLATQDLATIGEPCHYTPGIQPILPVGSEFGFYKRSLVLPTSGGTGMDFGAGFDNTDLIDAGIQCPGTPCHPLFTYNNIAATLCKNHNGGGLNDWFLPSGEEMIEASSYNNTAGTNPLQFINGGVQRIYWTSSIPSQAPGSIYQDGLAIAIDVGTGLTNVLFRCQAYSVRPIRRFECIDTSGDSPTNLEYNYRYIGDAMHDSKTPGGISRWYGHPEVTMAEILPGIFIPTTPLNPTMANSAGLFVGGLHEIGHEWMFMPTNEIDASGHYKGTPAPMFYSGSTNTNYFVAGNNVITDPNGYITYKFELYSQHEEHLGTWHYKIYSASGACGTSTCVKKCRGKLVSVPGDSGVTLLWDASNPLVPMPSSYPYPTQWDVGNIPTYAGGFHINSPNTTPSGIGYTYLRVSVPLDLNVDFLMTVNGNPEPTQSAIILNAEYNKWNVTAETINLTDYLGTGINNRTIISNGVYDPIDLEFKWKCIDDCHNPAGAASCEEWIAEFQPLAYHDTEGLCLTSTNSCMPDNTSKLISPEEIMKEEQYCIDRDSAGIGEEFPKNSLSNKLKYPLNKSKKKIKKKRYGDIK